MTFEDYAKQAISTDTFGGKAIESANDPAFISKLLGLVGESGEVAEKFKKIIRDKGGVLTPEDVAEIKKELGDVLWYINAMSYYLGFSLTSVAEGNLDKVLGRKARGVTHGNGDNR